MTIEISEFDPSKDYDAIKDLMMLLTSHLKEEFNERQFRITVSRRKADRINRHGILLAKEDDKVIGMIWGEITLSKIGKISNFIIKDGYRGKGIGNQLIQNIIDFFTKHKVNRIHANVRNMEKEGKLYEKFGFKKLFCTMER